MTILSNLFSPFSEYKQSSKNKTIAKIRFKFFETKRRETIETVRRRRYYFMRLGTADPLAVHARQPNAEIDFIDTHEIFKGNSTTKHRRT